MPRPRGNEIIRIFAVGRANYPALASLSLFAQILEVPQLAPWQHLYFFTGKVPLSASCGDINI